MNIYSQILELLASDTLDGLYAELRTKKLTFAQLVATMLTSRYTSARQAVIETITRLGCEDIEVPEKIDWPTIISIARTVARKRNSGGGAQQIIVEGKKYGKVQLFSSWLAIELARKVGISSGTQWQAYLDGWDLYQVYMADLKAKADAQAKRVAIASEVADQIRRSHAAP